MPAPPWSIAPGDVPRPAAGAGEPAPLGEFRRLRYFSELLEQGYHAALSPDLLTGTLRPERLALGLDLPELDVVGLWSVRREDGAIAIPFVDFILEEIRARMHRLCAAAGPGAGDSALRRDMAEVDRLLGKVNPSGGEHSALPDLRDHYLPETTLARLCAPGGPVQRIVRRCESLTRSLAVA